MWRYLTRLTAPLLLLPAAASAADLGGSALHPYLNWRHLVGLGIYEQTMHAEISESRRGIPTRLSVNLSHLNVDDEHTDVSLAYLFRFNERWSLAAAANRFAGDGVRGRGRSFSLGPIEAPLGVGIATDIQIDTYVLDILYNTYRSDRAEFAIGAGLHAFNADISLTSTAVAGRNERGNSVEVDEFVAPLPNLRLQGFYAFTPRISISGAFGWLSANIDEWDGSFLYGTADLSFHIGRGFNASLGYQYTDVDITRERRVGRSEYDLEFSGPSIHLSYGF